jgi:CheY-like chemotaxis protein
LRPATVHAEPSSRAVGRPRILVVDDDPVSRSLCERILAALGTEVVHAADGDEGLDRATTLAPDLIISDVNMPGRNGIELAHAIRLDRRTRELPIIFISGEADPDVQARAFAAGALAFLLKPFDPAALRELASAALRGDRLEVAAVDSG